MLVAMLWRRQTAAALTPGLLGLHHDRVFLGESEVATV
jgi:hypothetical protein